MCRKVVGTPGAVLEGSTLSRTVASSALDGAGRPASSRGVTAPTTPREVHSDVNREGAIGVTLQIAPFLQAVVVNNGSDLHIKVGSPPKIRISGSLVPLQVDPLTAGGRRGADPGDHAGRTRRRTSPRPTRPTSPTPCPASAGSASTPSAPAARPAGLPPGQRRRRSRSTTSACPPCSARSPWSRAAWCWSPAPPARARRRRSPAMIDHINNNREVHIVTIEDPIEVLHYDKLSMINQREVRLDTADFAIALRAAMRQDPDVILVGEMRDPETVKAALAAAETGHFVMSTLHTTDAHGDDQPHHRLLPAARAEAGPAGARRRAARHHLPAPRAPRRRPGPLRRHGDLRQHRPDRRRHRRPRQDRHASTS